MSKAHLTFKIGLTFVFEMILALGFGLLYRPNISMATFVFAQEIFLLIMIWLLNRFYLKQPIHFSYHGTWGQILPLLFLSAFLAATLLGLIPQHPHADLKLPFMIGLGAAIFEEYCFRGVIFGLLLRRLKAAISYKRTLLAAACSALLFGLMHLLNLTRQAAIPTFMQIIQVTALGMIFAALYLRSGSLLVPMLTHFLLDFTSTFGNQSITVSDQISWGSTLMVTLFYLVIAAVYLRPSQFPNFKLLSQ